MWKLSSIAMVQWKQLYIHCTSSFVEWINIVIDMISFRSKTAANLEEGRVRFDRLNMRLHVNSLLASDASTTVSTTTETPAPVSHNDEDEMDAFLRQAYADGMFDDDNDNHLPPPPQDSIEDNHRREDVITISDEEDNRHDPFENILPDISSPIRVHRPAKIVVSLPYTYLSLIRSQTILSYQVHRDYSIKGCFSSLVTNPRLIKNEFDLQAYLNDGSDCLLVRLASDLLAQGIGITVNELLSKRQQYQSDFDKQKFQADFNERLKRFGQRMRTLISIMTIRFFADNRMPMVISIEENLSD